MCRMLIYDFKIDNFKDLESLMITFVVGFVLLPILCTHTFVNKY